jgi:hypothetical protein
VPTSDNEQANLHQAKNHCTFAVRLICSFLQDPNDSLRQSIGQEKTDIENLQKKFDSQAFLIEVSHLSLALSFEKTKIIIQTSSYLGGKETDQSGETERGRIFVAKKFVSEYLC